MPDPVALMRKALTYVPAARVKYHKGWDDRGNSGKGVFDPEYVILHHTAGRDSLALLRDGNRYKPVRGSHVLIARDGTVHVIAAYVAYHAGSGGPLGGVAKDSMNRHAWGIEIESMGRAKDLTPEQIDSTSRLTAGMIAAVGSPLGKVINHKTWSSTGKIDTLYSDAFWRAEVGKAQKKKVAQMATWKLGESKMVKPEEAVPVVGGKWTTLTQITIPKGARYLVTLQVRMPRGVAGGEAQLGRIGWGTPGQAIDSTGHNPIPPASFELRWRTPIHHEMAGGGPVAFMIWLPAAAKPHEMRYVAKATRFA